VVYSARVEPGDAKAPPVKISQIRKSGDHPICGLYSLAAAYRVIVMKLGTIVSKISNRNGESTRLPTGITEWR
jgi:hypothetical protein